MRAITQEQFADQTTPDGNRIDRALSDVVSRINNVPPGFMARRWLPQHFCTGFQPLLLPLSGAGINPVPFLVDPNRDNEALAAKVDAYANPRRVKGTYLGSAKLQDYVWTNALAFSKPAVLSEITVCLLTDSVAGYVNDFLDVCGNLVNDVHVVVSVDDPWRPEDRTRNAVVVGRHQFKAEAEFICPHDPAPGWIDMTHPWPGDRITGIAVRATDLSVPIHQNARVRICLVLPYWDKALDPWGGRPWDKCYYSLDACWLEEVSA